MGSATLPGFEPAATASPRVPMSRERLVRAIQAGLARGQKVGGVWLVASQDVERLAAETAGQRAGGTPTAPASPPAA